MQSNRIADGVLYTIGFLSGCFLTALTIFVAVDTGFAAQLSKLSCEPNLLKDYGDSIVWKFRGGAFPGLLRRRVQHELQEFPVGSVHMDS